MNLDSLIAFMGVINLFFALVIGIRADNKKDNNSRFMSLLYAVFAAIAAALLAA